jgi:putative acetyltransferase
MIREMHNEDMKRIGDIWLEDSILLHSFFPDAERFWREKLPCFLQETHTAVGYVCEAAGAVNGFVTIRADDLYIYSLYVDFHLRGHGIGSALLDRARTLSDRLHLHVYQKDIDAACFYIRQGFIILDPRYGPEKGTGQFKYYMEWKRDASRGQQGRAHGS